MGKNDKVRLHVQICAYGMEGLESVAAHSHPEVNGVRWLVSLQMPEGQAYELPEELARRDDFDIIVHNDRGLSRNRNHALEFPCESDYVLIADDDVDYFAEALQTLVETFDSHPDVGIITCRYLCGEGYPKPYSDKIFSLDNPPKGYYISSVEIAVRRNAVSSVRFNENFGVGSGVFAAGEEDLWVHQLMKRGVKGIGVPIDLCRHDDITTGYRDRNTREYLLGRGLLITYMRPLTFLPRLLLSVVRADGNKFKHFKYVFLGAIYRFVKPGLLRVQPFRR